MDWSQVTSLTIPEGSVKQVSVNGVVLWKKSLLPSGYTQLEYIESTGTQCIDTGIINWNNTLEYEIKLSIQQQSGVKTYFGCYDEWNTSKNNVPNISTWTNYKVASNFRAGYGSSSGTDIGIINGQTGTISLKGNTISWSEGSSSSFDRGYDFTVPSSIFLFAQHSGNDTTELATTKIYYAKFWLNGELVRNLIPVMRNSDGKVGMYDTVRNIFLTNAGTGEFIAGGFVLPKGYTKLEYLQSDSKAYINTGIAGGVDTLEVGCKFSWSKFVSYGAVYGNYISDAHNGIRLILHNVDDIMLANSNTICTTTGNTEFNCARNAIHTVVNKYDTINVDGTVTTRTNKEKGTANSENIALFNRSLTNPNTTRDIGLKVYSFYIKNSDELACNLVPCRRNPDSALGMYDTVRNIFLPNAGTGEFIAGPRFVEYIEFDGNSWIDTGITQQTCRIECGVEFINHNNNATQLMGFHPSLAGYWGINFRGKSTFYPYLNVNPYQYRDVVLNFDATDTKKPALTLTIGNATSSPEFGSVVSTSTTYVMGGIKSGSTISYNNFMKVHYNRIYNANNELIQDLRPCLDPNNVACMYDMVTGTYFYNQGTGEFIAGGTV